MKWIDKLVIKSKGFGGARTEDELDVDTHEIYLELNWGQRLCHHENIPGAVGELARKCILLKGHRGDHAY